MREIAEERLQPADLAQAHRTICDWHLKHSRPADALQHADCAGDWERISLLMLLHFHELSAAAKRQAGQILSRDAVRHAWHPPPDGMVPHTAPQRCPGHHADHPSGGGETILGSLDPAAEGLHAMVVDGVKFAVHRTLGDFETSDELISGLLPQVEALRGHRRGRARTDDDRGPLPHSAGR
ncbi:hypothetical protein [Nesterenkonia sp. NBAIMH1]|uniref:hypothetical protein n=1 Tax=Nesterenkonia sp. NBAIMH1 TaxID=2600320 RepID=UPI00143CD4BF|nr:hypothetical protein [Nesterenkonia sp. NBAIMH1]